VRAAAVAALGAALLLMAGPGAAQLSFPTSLEDYEHFYPTAYFDHGGLTDWNCGQDTYGGHSGSDFGGGSWAGMAAGRDITAAAAGVVYATNDGVDDMCSTGDCGGGGGYGNYVQIDQLDGYRVTYAHLATWSVAVAAGDVVACGELLGLMGSSGNSTGPHLHFDLRVPGEARFDPFAGPCSDAAASFWAAQGAYGGLPAIQCGAPAVCEPVALLTCGAAVTSANDAEGSTAVHFTYGCPGGFLYSGPEIAFRFVTDLDESVQVQLTGLTADLDLFVLASAACDGSGCLAESTSSQTGDEALAFDAAAGVEAVIVVDGWQGATSGFTLGIECDGGLPQDPDAGPDAGPDADADTDADADSDVDSDADGDADGDDDDDDDDDATSGSSDSGCGCRHAGPRPSGLLAALRRLG
jgi:hypothetical protein